MNDGRLIWRLMAILAVIAAMAGVGVYAYNVGVDQGVAEAARVAALGDDGTPAALYYPVHYDGPGFGFFGLLFTILAIFLVIGLVRAAFGRGRWGGPRGSYGGRWGPPGPGRWGGPREYLEQWHREAHGEPHGETPPEGPTSDPLRRVPEA
ncbi:MAG: hypothetical protein ABR509_01960 [Candidatus Limnocylindria bacterium]